MAIPRLLTRCFLAFFIALSLPAYGSEFLARADTRLPVIEESTVDSLVVNRVLVKKGQRRLYLMNGEEIVRSYRISLGDNPEGHKLYEGDERTPEGDYTLEQIRKFNQLLEDLKQDGIEFSRIHIANSDAINNFSETCNAPFNLVRTGINLYGLFDETGARRLNLKSIVSLKTRLAAVRTLPAGAYLGYGLTCKLIKPTRVGTIAAGYADGLPLMLSNRGYVVVRGVLCPVIGRISMDYTTISLENVPDAACGDEIICLGGTPPAAVTVDNWALTKGTNPYDILCSFGSRTKRVYID